jgi:hypothetical protein
MTVQPHGAKAGLHGPESVDVRAVPHMDDMGWTHISQLAGSGKDSWIRFGPPAVLRQNDAREAVENAQTRQLEALLLPVPIRNDAEALRAAQLIEARQDIGEERPALLVDAQIDGENLVSIHVGQILTQGIADPRPTLLLKVDFASEVTPEMVA